MFPTMGCSVRGSRNCREMLEKSPRRCAAVGTTAVEVAGRWRNCVPCHDPKKNVLFLTIGPPIENPYWLRFRPSSVGAKKLRAFSL